MHFSELTLSELSPYLEDSSPKKPTGIPDPIVANEIVPANSRSSEEKIVDSFLDEVNKKRVSDEIRQRKREEKLAKVETVSPEKDEQVSVDKRVHRKENQTKQREKFIQEVSEGAVTKVTPDDSIPLVSSQRELDSSTNCSNIIDEPGSSSLDVCLEKTVEMGTPTFSLLYEKLCDAVILADRATQEAIFCYCQFGKALIKRRGEIASEKQVDLESNTVSRILNTEIKAQLPAGTSDALLRKRIEQAKKLYTLFNAIDNMSFDYSIHIETQLCEPSSQSDNKNPDLSHITSSNAPTEFQVPNESATKKLDTKA
ncbi:12553_t:CDS:2 [Gigaspora margarita]|uniref:12553_t:CDS:1 n=1 Tax=Gigaspora margarita TaxID=4874 RepID=A0ABN7VRB4_GIGMA|nr:12553_t:CDS:2 [Gigaspora margarita]